MATSQSGQQGPEAIVEILRDILIAQLGIAGIPQKNIREIVGCGISRVNKIVRHLKITKSDQS
jgi:hypothetical protein